MYDLSYVATGVGADLVVETWISHGPRASDESFDPKPGDWLVAGDNDEPPYPARVTRRDANHVWVQLELGLAASGPAPRRNDTDNPCPGASSWSTRMMRKARRRGRTSDGSRRRRPTSRADSVHGQRLEQLELDAVHAVAEDLREELGRLNAKRVTMERHPAQANVVEAAGGPGRAVVLIHGCLCPARVGVLNFRAVRRQRRIRLVP